MNGTTTLPNPVIPVERRCMIEEVFDQSFIELLRLVPRNPYIRALILKLTKKMPGPECETFEQVKEWVETNCEKRTRPTSSRSTRVVDDGISINVEPERGRPITKIGSRPDAPIPRRDASHATWYSGFTTLVVPGAPVSSPPATSPAATTSDGPAFVPPPQDARITPRRTGTTSERIVLPPQCAGLPAPGADAWIIHDRRCRGTLVPARAEGLGHAPVEQPYPDVDDAQWPAPDLGRGALPVADATRATGNARSRHRHRPGCVCAQPNDGHLAGLAT